LSGSRIRMRTAGRGQDVRPEKTLYLNLEKKLIFLPHPEYLGSITSTGISPRRRVPRFEIRPVTHFFPYKAEINNLFNCCGGFLSHKLNIKPPEPEPVGFIAIAPFFFKKFI